MKLSIREMNEDFAVQILNWKYDAPYNFYNNELDGEAIQELIECSYKVVVDQNDNLVGFFCIGTSAQVPIGIQFGAYLENHIDVGIGMKPELTGQGNGTTFFSFILKYIQESNNDKCIRLTVAEFNHRAIQLYEKLGFKRKMEFVNGATVFIVMVRERI